MKKSAAEQWLGSRMRSQNRVLMMALIAMVGPGLVAWAFESLLVWGILRIGFLSSGILAFIVTLLILGCVQFATWLRLPITLPDHTHSFLMNDQEWSVNTWPVMGQVWTYALGSLETDRSWIERLLGLLALPQRMLSAAWYVWQRLTQLKNLDITLCAAVIRLLHRKSERIDTAEIVAETAMTDPLRTLREISLVEGVVFLSTGNAGLTITPRLMDELNAWGRSED